MSTPNSAALQLWLAFWRQFEELECSAAIACAGQHGVRAGTGQGHFGSRNDGATSIPDDSGASTDSIG